MPSRTAAFPAHVRRVAPYVLDTEKQARTVEVEAEIDDRGDALLLPGYSADVEVILAEHADVLRIPTRALIEGNGSTCSRRAARAPGRSRRDSATGSTPRSRRGSRPGSAWSCPSIAKASRTASRPSRSERAGRAPMIELRSVSRHFQVGDQLVQALDEVALAIGDGEYVSIMGPCGSGKSTLLNVIGLLDRPTGGEYLLDGRGTTSLDDDELAHVRARKVGFIFQSFHLVPRLTAFENVELPMVLAAMAPAERRERAQAVLASLNLTDRAHHRPDQLSGGQRQRVAIARAMVMQPPCCSPTSPPATSTTCPATRCSRRSSR